MRTLQKVAVLLALTCTWAPAQDLMQQVPLIAGSNHWNVWKPASAAVEWLESAPGVPSLKLTFPELATGGAICRHLGITPGARYLLTVKVRGKGALTGHLFQYDANKKAGVKHMLELAKLTPAWSVVEREIEVSNGMTLFTANFLLYKQEGWFELTELSLKAVSSASELEPRKLWPRKPGAPAAWWTFDDGDREGITVFDRIADQHGDLTEGVVPIPGRIGRALRFDGKRGLVLCDQAPVLDRGFSIMAWVRIERFTEAWHTFYSGDTKGCPQFRANPDGQLALVRSEVKMAGLSREKLKAGAWTHVAVTWEESGRYRFFINGADAGAGQETAAPFDVARRAALGQVAVGGVPRALRGDLDEVLVWDRTLTPEEVREQVAVTANPPVDHVANRRPGTIELMLKCASDFNWFTTGQAVTFRPAGDFLLPEIQAVTGTLFDMDGAIVANVRADRATLEKTGWTWTPPVPGYYELLFTYETSRGLHTNRVSYPLLTSKGTKRQFTRAQQAVVVMPPPRGPRPQFGFSYGSGLEEELALAQVFGFSFARWHFIAWGAHWGDERRSVEPRRGEYRWELTDPHVALLKKAGYELIGNVLFTPAWASSHPEDDSLGLGIPGRSVWAPTEMGDWARFLERLVGRYRDSIRTWELWNEPHLPGGSVFWKDTPAKYAELLRTGYEAVKKTQPEGTVWFGGMGGKRYLPFYREFLKTGGAPFDVLPMHGSWPEISGFRALEKEFGVPSKPWVSSEWHAVLLSAMPRVPSEAEIAKRLVLDFCEQLRHGAERIAVFCLKEYGEKELLPVAYGDGSFQQSAGLFRTKPRAEPRLAAVALRTFIDQVDGSLAWKAFVELSSGQRLVWFLDGNRTLAILWGDEAASSPDARLASALASAVITGFDGRPVKAERMVLDTNHLYFVRGLPQPLLAALPASAASLNPASRQRAVAATIHGAWHRKPLFTPALAPEGDGAALRWQTVDWKYQRLQAPRAAGFSARYAVGLSEQGLDLWVVVTDPLDVPSPKASEPWLGDSVQFALDTEGRSVAGAQAEFIAFRSGSMAVLQKTMAASIGGDIPQRWTPAGRPIEYGRARVERNGNEIQYRIHVELSELYPFMIGKDTRELRLSVLVNNNDGQGRAGYLEWSSGIGSGKDPGEFGALKLVE